MKKIILFLLFLLSLVLMSNNENYYYGIKDTVITGTLVRGKIKNPEGYNKNVIIYPYFVLLDYPVRITKSEDTLVRTRYETFQPEYNVSQIQLNFDSSKMKIDNLEGKKVIVRGFLFHSSSFYHYTEVIIDVENIESL